ncbi:efflux transporter outer membrane subunit [Malikia sp.]|uniref:efflux transporter outer membrane subunit n=1 Tax=Malikia sp. TaxID=2070706 RepID=UPI00262370FD|nr:efflux transporter outer membrane subunit [Malikia sp.]MDD2728848.1 efflux transporter outer membrane subunit [Malikia sp.]
MNKIPLTSLGPLAAALLLGGCSLMPAYERPTAPVPAHWPASAGATAQPGASHQPDSASVAADELPDWQGFFSDPALRQLIETALAHNRDLRVAALNLEQARAQLGLRRAEQWPGVGLAVNGSRTPNSSGDITSSYSGGLLVTAYELDFFGRVSSLKEQALAQYLASEAGRQSVRIGLVAGVAQGWLALLADQAQLELARQTLSAREASLGLIRLRLEHGATSELELRQAESLIENARVTLAQFERQRAQDENALALLLGQPLDPALRAELAAQRLTALQLPQLAAGLPSQRLTRRPDIVQAEQQLIAANANIGAARAAFFPRISLTTGIGSASGELSGLFKDGSWGFTLAPQLLLPIFDAGRNQAGLDAARAGREAALAQYEKAIQSAFREVADALAGRETLARQLQAQQAQTTADARRLDLTELRLRHGAASQLDWLDAQRSLYASQQALTQTRLAYWQNQVTLYKVLGGG